MAGYRKTGRRGRVWHEECCADRYVLSRLWPARFDFAVVRELPVMGRARLARQLRQDMWRALRDLRGFAPVVEVVRDGAGLRVTAGGAVAGRFDRAAAEEAVAGVMDCPMRRARWARWAAVKDVMA